MSDTDPVCGSSWGRSTEHVLDGALVSECRFVGELLDGGFLLGDPAAVAPADLAGVLGGDEGHSSAENAIERDRPGGGPAQSMKKPPRRLAVGRAIGDGGGASKSPPRSGPAQNPIR